MSPCVAGFEWIARTERCGHTVCVRRIEYFCEKVELARISSTELEDVQDLNSDRDRNGRCASDFLRSAHSSITAEMVSVVKVTTLLR